MAEIGRSMSRKWKRAATSSSKLGLGTKNIFGKIRSRSSLKLKSEENSEKLSLSFDSSSVLEEERKVQVN